MRFSDVMLSVGFVGLAAADPQGGYCSEKPNGVLECRLDPTPASTNTCPTAKAHVHTTTTTIHIPIATETAIATETFIATTTVPVPIATATIRAIPMATAIRYKLALATPSSGASRRYSVPGLFMLPHRIMGLMAGAQPAAANKAIKTVTTISTRTTTETVHALSVTTEFEPSVTKVLAPTTETEAVSTRTKTETVHALSVTTEFEPLTTKVLVPTTKAKPERHFAPTAGGNNGDYDGIYSSSGNSGGDSKWEAIADRVGTMGNRFARRAFLSDELPTTTFVPTTTETFSPQLTTFVPATSETVLPQPTSTVEMIRVVMPELDTINVAINIDTDKTDTDTVTQTSSVWVSPSVILPSVSTEPTVTNARIVETTTQTTKTWELTNRVRSGTATVSYVTVTGGASRPTQPPKVFSLLASLFGR